MYKHITLCNIFIISIVIKDSIKKFITLVCAASAAENVITYVHAQNADNLLRIFTRNYACGSAVELKALYL